jgi:hypothetical protein
MENGTDTIPEGSFRDGDDEVFISLYRVEQDDLTIGTITALLPQLSGSFHSQITELNNDLTANSKKFEASYQNGKYGFTIDGVFYEIGGGGMPILDFANPLHRFTSGGDGLSYTATGECYLYGTFVGGAGHGITINGKQIVAQPSSFSSVVSMPITRLKSGDIVACTTTELLYVLAKIE